MLYEGVPAVYKEYYYFIIFLHLSYLLTSQTREEKLSRIDH